MTHEETQSPLADRQEHQARTTSSDQGDCSTLGNATQAIPSIIVTDASPNDASVDPLRLNNHIAGTTSPDDLGIVQGTDTEPDACVRGSHNQEIAPLQSDIDNYVPWFTTDNYFLPDKSKGGDTVRGTLIQIYYLLGLLAGAFSTVAAIILLGLSLPSLVTSLPLLVDQT